MPLLTRKRTILLKTEATYGTDAAPAGADALVVRSINVTPISADTVSRDLIRPCIHQLLQLPADGLQALAGITEEAFLLCQRCCLGGRHQ